MDEQQLLEKNYSRRGLISLLREELKIDDLVDAIYSIEEYRNNKYSYESKNIRVSDIPCESVDIAYQLVASVMRCNGTTTPIQIIAASLAPMLSDDLIDGIRTGAEIIAVCEGKLYECLSASYEDNTTGGLAVEPYITPSTEALVAIEEFMYIPPLILKPKPWNSNKGGGLHTQVESCILGKENHHNQYQALDCLNILQDIEWQLDPKILALKEEPNKVLDTVDKIKQFSLMSAVSKRVYQDYQNLSFHFMWQFDKRGRMYSAGYHINIQSTDYKKALLSFKTKEVITI